MVHVGDNHWASFTTVGCLDGEVYWLDSLSLNPSSRAQKLITDVMQYSGDRILIRVTNVQMQQGFSDCGVFAAAFVTAIYYGLDPSNLYFAQDAMRAHLLKCLQERHMTLFPVLKKQSRRLAVLCTLEVEIFCLCHHLPVEGTMIRVQPV